jgi:hypothetical protein
VAWTTEDAGHYVLRAFAISNFTAPTILSVTMISEIKIEPYAPNSAARVAFNTTQCADPWDVAYFEDSMILAPGETRVEHYFRELGVAVYKTREVPIYPPGSMAFCEACGCSSGETLYIEVARLDLSEMKGYGFVEQSPR